MIEIILKILFISAFCNGLYLITDDGMVLNFILRAFRPYSNKFFYKPIIGCLPCMASVWGTIIYWVLTPFSLEALYIYPFVIISCSYTNNALHKLL